MVSTTVSGVDKIVIGPIKWFDWTGVFIIKVDHRVDPQVVCCAKRLHQNRKSLSFLSFAVQDSDLVEHDIRQVPHHDTFARVDIKIVANFVVFIVCIDVFLYLHE